MELPPSLKVEPNKEWRKQIVEELEQERDYRAWMLREAGGPASASATQEFHDECVKELNRRAAEPSRNTRSETGLGERKTDVSDLG